MFHQNLEREMDDMKLGRGSLFVHSSEKSFKHREVIYKCFWWYWLLQQTPLEPKRSGLVIIFITPIAISSLFLKYPVICEKIGGNINKSNDNC